MTDIILIRALIVIGVLILALIAWALIQAWLNYCDSKTPAPADDDLSDLPHPDDIIIFQEAKFKIFVCLN